MLIAIAIAEEIQGLQKEESWGDLQRIGSCGAPPLGSAIVKENSEAQNLQNFNAILCNPWISSAMAMAMSIYRTLVFVFFFSFLIAHLGECFFVFFLSFSFLIFFLAIWWSGDQKVLLVSIRRQTHHLPWPDHNRTAKIMIVRKKLKRNTQRNTPLSIMGIRPWKLWR